MRGAVIGKDDLGEATTVMGRCLFHRQRDLLLETWNVRTDASSLDRQSRDHQNPKQTSHCNAIGPLMLQAQVTQPLTGSTGLQHPPGGESGAHQPWRCLIGGGQRALSSWAGGASPRTT